MRILRDIFIVIFSAGWVIPLWISVYSYLTFVETELRPYIIDAVFSKNSMPYIRLSLEAFTIFCIWLSAVLIFWTWNSIKKKKN